MIQLALAGFAEFVLHLTRMNPDMMYLHQDCGYLNISYFKFDIDDQLGELDANRPVPFRLTPNIAEFLTATGVTGPLTASMVSAARCFVQPQYKLISLLRAILRDEYITWHKKVGGYFQIWKKLRIKVYPNDRKIRNENRTVAVTC
jgi:transformation/transcription domain-associated protein